MRFQENNFAKVHFSPQTKQPRKTNPGAVHNLTKRVLFFHYLLYNIVAKNKYHQRN